MTDTPNRSIGGLAPRSTGGQPDLSRLQRRNRENAASAAARSEHAPVTPLIPASTPRAVATAAPTEAEAAPATAMSEQASVDPAAPDRVTVYLERALRGRARAAYRATAHLNGDRSWSDFVERAIRTEVERREQAHNDGQPYIPSSAKLAPGRGVS